MTTYTAWAYHCDTGRIRRAQRRYHSADCARRAAERLIDGDGGWEWAISPRGARSGDHEGGRPCGDWQLVVRPHA